MKPSEQLLRLIRDAANQKGLNTAAIAGVVGMSRSELKHILAGQEPLTVDMLVDLAEALELGPEELAWAEINAPEPPATLEPIRKKQSLTDLTQLDPYGNHAEQILRLGFALGCDMHVVLHSERLGDTGIPDDTIAQFPDLLPIKLDAEYHHHNDPKFTPNGAQLVLSFDSLCTTVIPWDAFAQITMIPIEPELSDVPEPPRGHHSHLRLIE